MISSHAILNNLELFVEPIRIGMSGGLMGAIYGSLMSDSKSPEINQRRLFLAGICWGIAERALRIFVQLSLHQHSEKQRYLADKGIVILSGVVGTGMLYASKLINNDGLVVNGIIYFIKLNSKQMI